MAVVLQIIRSLVPAGGMPPVLATILSRMQPDSATAFQDWQSVAVALKGTEARVLPAAAAQINAADRAAEAALEATRRENKRGLLIQVGSLGALLVVVIVVVILKFWSNERDLSAQVQIPGGVYPLGDPDNPREVELAPFEIDKYEVSIAQFEEFLKWERENTDQIYKFRHPKEPPGTRHQPDKWEVWRSHAVHGVSEGRKPGRELELNTPVFGVTYWSAWAYAKWKGRSLPTEDQWEAAARGKKLFSYPWGNEWNDKNTNSGVDYDEKISGAPTAGKKDGFATWAPTDRLPRDKSPFGVMSMAGNVAEWVEPDSKTRKPVVKGGSFATEPRPLWFRLETLAAEDNSYVYPGSDSKQKKGDKITLSSTAEYIGFRTVKASGAAK
jgi:formylglycine-generating enzyme required for sulfatase activity